MEKYADTFRKRFKSRRKELGMNQVQLSKKTKLHCSWISSVEHGRRLPSFYNIIRLAKVLECTTDWLLGIDNE